jgi:hypothetical protein
MYLLSYRIEVPEILGRCRHGVSVSGDDICDCWLAYKKRKPQGGKMIVNKNGHVLMRAPVSGRTRTLFLGKITDDDACQPHRADKNESYDFEF